MDESTFFEDNRSSLCLIFHVIKQHVSACNKADIKPLPDDVCRN